MLDPDADRQCLELRPLADRNWALTHLGARAAPRLVKDEARRIFANTVVPRDFDTIELPLP